MDDGKLYEIWLASRPGLSCRARLLLRELFGGAKGVYMAEERELKRVLAEYSCVERQVEKGAIFSKDTKEAERIIKRLEAIGAGAVDIDDPDYPAQLAAIPDPPTLLYYKGDLGLVKEAGVAVVGTRRCSSYGRWAATEIGGCIARCGLVVISGMAEGIDSAAHLGCMRAGGKTVAVFGTGIDLCFPKSNAALYAELADSHLILSELKPSEKGMAWNFPQRNRIISGLSRAVIVVEGALKSGSMISAGFAAEQGREVLAVPGNITQINSMGTNRLIADGALPVVDIAELPGLLGCEKTSARKRRCELSAQEQELLRVIKNKNGEYSEIVAAASDLSARDFTALVCALELKGLIASRERRLYVL